MSNPTLVTIIVGIGAFIAGWILGPVVKYGLIRYIEGRGVKKAEKKRLREVLGYFDDMWKPYENEKACDDEKELENAQKQFVKDIDEYESEIRSFIYQSLHGYPLPDKIKKRVKKISIELRQLMLKAPTFDPKKWIESIEKQVKKIKTLCEALREEVG